MASPRSAFGGTAPGVACPPSARPLRSPETDGAHERRRDGGYLRVFYRHTGCPFVFAVHTSLGEEGGSPPPLRDVRDIPAARIWRTPENHSKGCVELPGVGREDRRDRQLGRRLRSLWISPLPSRRHSLKIGNLRNCQSTVTCGLNDPSTTQTAVFYHTFGGESESFQPILYIWLAGY